MKVALVHDYLREFGGAERVLKVLSEIYPQAPIYTAFRVRGSTADREFLGKKIKESFLAPILKIDNFYSPLRFLAPLIWKSFDLSKYDLVITSCSWYITRGFSTKGGSASGRKVGPKTKVVAYCHTPPRWLYGYETSVGLTKYWPVKVYAAIVGHFMRIYDWNSAQKVDHWIANSKNVAERIKKFYRRESTVIYPPVDVESIKNQVSSINKKGNYFLIVSRLVGAKGLEEAAEAFKNSKYKLKIAGEAHGFSAVEKRLKRLSGGNVELVGRVSDEELYGLYAKAKGFIALARDEDFGITVVEAQAAGTPVIAFNGGGFKESVIDPSAGSGQAPTGVLINDTDEKTIAEAINKLEKIKWDKEKLQANARRFAKDRFIKEIKEFVNSKVNF